MLTALVTRIVTYATYKPWRVIVVSKLVALFSLWFVITHFAISTDIGKLISTDAPWAKADAAISVAFPQRDGLILAVVEAPAVELADAAANALAAALAKQPGRFRAISQPASGPFFDRNGLLFLDQADVDSTTRQLIDSRPLLNVLARDPSLRGLADTLSTTLNLPLQTGQVKLADMARLLTASADAVEAVLAGKPGALSWQTLAQDDKPATGTDASTDKAAGNATPKPLAHSLIVVSPIVDFADLEAGKVASNAIRAAAVELKLGERYEASVHMTGPQALADDEFASVKEGAELNAVLTVLVVLLILWFALRSVRLIVAVLASLIVGLIVTAALGLAMVGALNMISVAFAVLFVGLGVDFGIQFGVRYRAERHDIGNLEEALVRTARALAVPLSLAAAATAAAFFCFWPTDYRGVAELGQIAGVGMVVAFATTITLLPALIRVLKPAGEPAVPGFPWLAPADEFFERYRTQVLVGTAIVILAGLPLLANLRFDSDPLHLKDPHAESMTTLRSLASSPLVGTDDVKVMLPSLEAARAMAVRLAALPEVARVTTLDTFIPTDQRAKQVAIAAAAKALMPVLDQVPNTPATDDLRVHALRNASTQLSLAAEDHPGAGADPAARLGKALKQLAGADAATRDRAERAIALPLRLSLARLRSSLQPDTVSAATLPAALARDWISPDGKALVNISPRLGQLDGVQREKALDQFVEAVLKVAPNAVGGPISIRGSAHTILHAFGEAGLWAVLSIALLLWVTLRRFGDVLRTLVPLLVSALVTLELCVLFGIPLNFANVIALPLLLGIGVAFKIYYVTAWREGQTKLLQSPLTHAVLFSAATTATAFGSLWFSHHPGTSSMGKLLALALVCTLIGAVFFQPILMGRPRMQRGLDNPAPTPGADNLAE